MLNINGTNVRLWRNKHEGKNGDWYSYAISVSRKVENEYVNKSVKAFVGKDVWIPDSVDSGALIDFEGFPTLDIYTDKEGKERREVAIFIQKIDWKGLADNFTEAEEDIPF